MAKNDFIAKQRALQRAFFDAGLQCGRQQILDMVSIVLRDPDIMGKDTFGKDRLLKVVKGVGDYIDYYQKAWEKHDETDYWRDKLDKALAAGMSYGKWKALQPRSDQVKPAIPADWKPCEYCGKYFKPTGKKRFCDAPCRVAAYDEKRKAGSK